MTNINIPQIDFTPVGKSYWNEDANYNKEYKELYKKLVPDSGSAKTLNGELIRGASRLNYEFFNNGNINACETDYAEEEYTCYACSGRGEFEGEDEDDYEVCCECDGCGVYSEEVESDSHVSYFYGKFLELIEENVPNSKPYVAAVEEIITDNLYGSSYQFSDNRKSAYTHLIDLVVHYVLYNEDKPLPTYYEQD